MNFLRFIRLIQYYYFTVCYWFVYTIKVIIDDVIALLLGFLLAAQTVGDYNDMRRAYIVCIIIIIIMICADKYLRSQSKTFDLWKTIVAPVNVGVGLNKIVCYRLYNHVIQVSLLILFELIKIGCIVFCLIDLAIEIIDNVFLNYVLLGIVAVNSLIGFVLYTTFLIHLIFIKNFYFNMLQWFAGWYLSCVIKVDLTMTGCRISLKFTELVDCN